MNKLRRNINVYIWMAVLFLVHAGNGKNPLKFLQIKRRIHGDIITEFDGGYYKNCEAIDGAEIERVTETCRCSPETPTFNAFTNTTYGCYDVKTFCESEDCIDLGIGSINNRDYQFTIDGSHQQENLFQAITFSCNNDLRKEVSIWNKSNWNVFSTDTLLGLRWNPAITIQVQGTYDDFAGKLVLVKYWCQNSRITYKYIFFKVSGNGNVIIEVNNTLTTTLSTTTMKTTSTTKTTPSTTATTTATLGTTFIKASLKNITKNVEFKDKASKKDNEFVIVIPIALVIIFIVTIMLLLFFWHRKRKAKRGNDMKSRDFNLPTDTSNKIQGKKSHINDIVDQENDDDNREPSYFEAEPTYYETGIGEITRSNPQSINKEKLTKDEPFYYETEPIYYVAGDKVGQQSVSSETKSPKDTKPFTNEPFDIQDGESVVQQHQQNSASNDEYAVVDKKLKKEVTELSNTEKPISSLYAVVDKNKKTKYGNMQEKIGIDDTVQNAYNTGCEYNYAYEEQSKITDAGYYEAL